MPKCFFFGGGGGSFLRGRKTHKQTPPPPKISGQSRKSCVYVCSFFCVFLLPVIGRERDARHCALNTTEDASREKLINCTSPCLPNFTQVFAPPSDWHGQQLRPKLSAKFHKQALGTSTKKGSEIVSYLQFSFLAVIWILLRRRVMRDFESHGAGGVLGCLCLYLRVERRVSKTRL